MLETAGEELKKAAADFYEISHVKIVLYDDTRKVIYSYPDRMCDFCSAVRTDEKLSKKCIECDNAGFDICDKTGKTHIYRCHMNLAEAIAPILENDVTIGYMMLGQVLINDDIENVENIIAEVSKNHNINTKLLLDKMKELHVMDIKSLNSAVNIMTMCACYLYVNKIIRNGGNLLSYQLKEYIDSHLTDNLSVSSICKKFFISKSKLYSISKECFGMGVSDYIRLKRLETAKAKLTETSCSISQAAELSGFYDANYFIRFFKKSTGQTPHQYRKSMQKKS